MKTPTKSRSYQMGAAHERQAIAAHLRRMLAEAAELADTEDPPISVRERQLLSDLIDWIKSRTKRFNAKPGGLGRKRKAKSVSGKIKCAFGCKVPSV